MFKVFYMRFLFRSFFLFAFCAFLGIFLYAFLTEVTFKGPGKSAPFTETLVNPQGENLIQTQRAEQLKKPHLTNKELENWSSQVVSEALSFSTGYNSQTLQSVQGYYTASGFRQYKKYLEDTGILKTLRDKNYRLSVFVDGQPLLLNSMAMDNVYRWLYQVPVTISFLPRNTNDLLGQKNMINRKLEVKVQIRRVSLPDDPNAVQVESWSATPRR